MYSSVPTKEFDCVFGSAKKIGGGWLVDLLFFSGGGLITCSYWHIKVDFLLKSDDIRHSRLIGII